MVMASLKAQEAIAAQSEGRATELTTVDPDKLTFGVIREDYAKLIRNNHYDHIVKMEDQLSETCAAVFRECESINSIDPKTFIDHGNANEVFTLHYYDWVNFGYRALSYESFFRSNYTVSPAQIDEICAAARANSMNVADYLNSVGYTEIYRFKPSGQYNILASEQTEKFSFGATGLTFFPCVDTTGSRCLPSGRSPMSAPGAGPSDMCLNDVLTF